jgi:hypothetical protein
VPNKPSQRQFKVRERVKVSLPLGHIVDATIRAVIEHTDRVRLQVDYGKDQTVLVQKWGHAHVQLVPSKLSEPCFAA